jgi:hypothetical protein
MLEPPTPAGEPFATHEGEEHKTTADFEHVCLSLVERGWKIMPKKGTYPINKQGPRYVNLVDPRGNRKSVRVTDENLWEKLRIVESKRTHKRESKKSSKGAENPPSSLDKNRAQGEDVNQVAPIVNDDQRPAVTPASHQPSLEQTNVVNPPIEIELNSIEEQSVLQSSSQNVLETTDIVPQARQDYETKTEIVENPAKEFQNIALTSPRLQKSIFDLGFETLLKALQSDSITPTEIVQKIQEWSMESENLTEYVHKWQESHQKPMLPDSSEKDYLIAELQSTLKETEEKLSEMLKSLREI